METTRATFALSGATAARDGGCRGVAWALPCWHSLPVAGSRGPDRYQPKGK